MDRERRLEYRRQHRKLPDGVMPSIECQRFINLVRAVIRVSPLYGGPQKTEEERFAVMPSHYSTSEVLGDGNRRRTARRF